MVKATTIPGGTHLPSIKAISVEPSIILVEITFAEALDPLQIRTLREIYANYRKSYPDQPSLALGITGRFVHFRTRGNKPAPSQEALRNMLAYMGIGEVNYVPPAPKKPTTKGSAPSKRQRQAVTANWLTHTTLR